jgi:carboxylesterase type B
LNKNPNVYTYEWIWSSILNDRGNPLPNWHRKFRPVSKSSKTKFLAAPHVCEIPYLFGYGDSYNNWTQTDQDLANSIQEKWANFAKYGYLKLSYLTQIVIGSQH